MLSNNAYTAFEFVVLQRRINWRSTTWHLIRTRSRGGPVRSQLQTSTVTPRQVGSISFWYITVCFPIFAVSRDSNSWSHGDGDDITSLGRPVIDGGSRGRVVVATQVAGASCVNVPEADTYAWECEAYAWECGACAGNADSQARVGCEYDWRCK